MADVVKMTRCGYLGYETESIAVITDKQDHVDFEYIGIDQTEFANLPPIIQERMIEALRRHTIHYEGSSEVK
jgi:hypothetical protein